MSTDKESSAAGTDNRPPMLDESDYESWRIRIERYIRGKPLGKLIWRSIQNGPTPHPQITVTEGQGEDAVQEHQVCKQLPPYWAKYVDNVKEHKDVSASLLVELYTYLKSYEPHAMKTLRKQEQSSSIVDPLAYLASTTHHHTPTQT
ncbi:hypothetical protein Tco_0403846 [Tanacetum coccineum]